MADDDIHFVRVRTDLESQGKSENFACGQGKFCISMFFSSCVICYIFNPSLIVACSDKTLELSSTAS